MSCVMGTALMFAVAVTVASAHTIVIRQRTSCFEQPRPGEVRCSAEHLARMRDAIDMLEKQQDNGWDSETSDQLYALHRMYGACWQIELGRDVDL